MLSVNSKYSDFRIFYSEQYFKLQYLGVLFLIYLINSISWKYTSFWSIFAYAANFIIFRIIGSTGTDQLAQTPGAISKPISSSFDLWEENKLFFFLKNKKSNKSNKTNNGSFGWRVWKTYAKNKRFTLIKLNHFLRAHNYYYKFMRKIKLSILKWYQLHITLYFPN